MNIENCNYLTVEEVAEILKTNKRTIARLVKNGKLRAFRPSPKKTYFTLEMVKEYLNDK